MDMTVSLFDVILVDQHLVGVEDHLVGEVAGFFLADDRVDEQTIDDGLSRFLHVFVPEVGNVAGLKADHGFPFFFLEQAPGFRAGSNSNSGKLEMGLLKKLMVPPTKYSPQVFSC